MFRSLLFKSLALFEQQQQIRQLSVKRLQPKMTAVVLGVPKRMREDPAFKKLDTPEFQKLFTEELKTLIDIFKRYDYELRIAGGAVRDLLLHIEPKDIDLATTATPDQMKEMFNKENVRMINAKGEKHGTITPRILDKENFEVTTLRIDVRTDGRHAEVQYTTDWQLDANRRDLTINSMFLGFDGTVYDYFYGYEDLMQRRVIFVGDAGVRIQEDYLRILRYFRFYGRIAQVANNHDQPTIKAIRENVNGLAHISGERIWGELQKILVGNFNMELMLEIIDCGLLPYCGITCEPNIEEFKRICGDLKNFDEPHHAILYLIGLLRTPEDAISLHERLKLSAFERDLAIFITENSQHLDTNFNSLKSIQKLIMLRSFNRNLIAQFLKYHNKLVLYNGLNTWQASRFPLNGVMLIENGCPTENKQCLGYVLDKLKEIWIDSEFMVSANDLMEIHFPEILKSLDTVEFPAPTSLKRKRKN